MSIKVCPHNDRLVRWCDECGDWTGNSLLYPPIPRSPVVRVLSDGTELSSLSDVLREAAKRDIAALRGRLRGDEEVTGGAKTVKSALQGGFEPPTNPFIEAKRRAAEERAKARKEHGEAPKDRKRAHKEVERAVRAGELVPEPCSWRYATGHLCGARPTQAHHESYEAGGGRKVRWLCSKHHGWLSGRARREKR